MRATVIQKVQDTRDDGRAPLYLRVSHRGRQLYVALGLAVPVERWDGAEGRMRGRSDEAATVNALCGRATAAARDADLALRASKRTVTAARVRDAVRASLSPGDGGAEAAGVRDALAFMRGQAAAFDAADRIRYARRFRTVADKVGAYARAVHGMPSVSFADLAGRPGARLLTGFGTYAQRPKPDGFGNSANTVASNLRVVRTALRSAMREGHFEPSDDPFVFLSIRERPVERYRLTLDQVAAVDALPLGDPGAFPDAEGWARVARDAFLFATYEGGMRFGDVARLRWDDVVPDASKGGHVVRYRQGKTGAEKAVPLAAPAARVLGPYQGRRAAYEGGDGPPWVFPLLDAYDTGDPPLSDVRATFRAVSARCAQTNRVLKTVAVGAGLARTEGAARLTFHVARHTFAESATQAGWDVYAVSGALGHSRIATTERYISGLARNDLGDNLDALFGH
jgi:integrase/recombinase XerD